jgi:hypothetical protein
MTPSPLHAISRKAQRILNRRGYAVVWSVTLTEHNAPETFVCTRGKEERLHIKLKICPNTLVCGADVARYCDDEIRILRRLMKNDPKTTDQYECWAALPFGKYYLIRVLPDTLVDMRSGEPIAQRPAWGVPA